MTISTRLALTYSAIASSIFIVFGFSVFVLSSNHRLSNFNERLKERVVVTEKMFLEKESFSDGELKKITNEFLHTLPMETEEVIEITDKTPLIFAHNYPSGVKKNFLSNDELLFENKSIQGISRIFHVHGKKYLIIVTAVDEIGYENLAFLRGRIMLLMLIGIPVIFIGGFLISKRALRPLSKKIEEANSISALSLHERLIIENPNDEIGKLAIAFNKLLDRLETSFDAQKSFISNASHEINNPLTAIIGEAEIAMSKSRPEDEYLASFQTILSEGEMLSATTKNLLQLSKVVGTEGTLGSESIDLVSFLTEVKHSYDFMNTANQISISFHQNESVSEAYVLGNRDLLKSAILNLLDNACKFSENAPVDVQLNIGKKNLTFTVKDNGIGIATEDLEQIMLPFYRGNNAIKITGSGIGLALSSKILQLHNGSLVVDSELNRGTKITVTLPLVSL